MAFPPNVARRGGSPAICFLIENCFRSPLGDIINTLRVVGLNDLINFFSHNCEGSNFGGGENYVFHLPHSFSPRAPLFLTPTSFLKVLRALYFEKFISLRDFIVMLGIGSGR